MYFKAWFMTVGIIITAWFMMLAGIGFFIWARWEKGRSAKVAAAFLLIIGALIILIYQVEPWNWDILYHTGELK